MKWLKASMVLVLLACVLGIWLMTNAERGGRVVGLWLLLGGFFWAVVVRLADSIATPRVRIEKDHHA